MGAAGLLRHRSNGRAVRYEIPYEEAATASVTPWTRTLHSTARRPGDRAR